MEDGTYVHQQVLREGVQSSPTVLPLAGGESVSQLCSSVLPYPHASHHHPSYHSHLTMSPPQVSHPSHLTTCLPQSSFLPHTLTTHPKSSFRLHTLTSPSLTPPGVNVLSPAGWPSESCGEEGSTLEYIQQQEGNDCLGNRDPPCKGNNRILPTCVTTHLYISSSTKPSASFSGCPSLRPWTHSLTQFDSCQLPFSLPDSLGSCSWRTMTI